MHINDDDRSSAWNRLDVVLFNESGEVLCAVLQYSTVALWKVMGKKLACVLDSSRTGLSN